MNAGDIFKKSFLEGYASGPLGTTSILACLLIAGALGVYIFFAYRFLCRKAYVDVLEHANFVDETVYSRYYDRGADHDDWHTMYIAYVEKILQRA